MGEKIKPEDLKAEKLEPRHIHLLPNFSTDNKELRAFLVEDSIKNQQLFISTTYLWFYNPTSELVAYISLLNDSLRIRETELEKIFVEKGVLYKSLPALKIGRLCVDKRFTGRGIGTFMTKFALMKAAKISEDAGCRFLVLDSKRESIDFYKKIGFDILKDIGKETVPMYYDLMKLEPAYKR